MAKSSSPCLFHSSKCVGHLDEMLTLPGPAANVRLLITVWAAHIAINKGLLSRAFKESSSVQIRKPWRKEEILFPQIMFGSVICITFGVR